MRMIELVRRTMPTCNAAYIAAFEQGDADFEKAGITTPLRQAHFLAQFGGETGGGRVLFESGNYRSYDQLMKIFGVGRHSAAIRPDEARRIIALPMPEKEKVLFERVYGAGNPKKMLELGNRPGDGWVFRGTGVLQSTGRGNAKRWSDRLGVDFVAKPELMVSPKYALAPALFVWGNGKLNTYADRNDIRTIRRVINGGYNGMQHVEDWFEKIYKIARSANDNNEAWQTALQDPSIQKVQNALNLLGYEPKLNEDGRMGPKTREAVKWFQKLNDLAVDGIPGPVTMTAINLRFATNRAVALVDDDVQAA